MRTQRTSSGARLLALLPIPLFCVLAALLGLPAERAAHGVNAEATHPIQSAGWGDRSAPADSHQFEKGRLRGSVSRPGFQSSLALPHANAFTAPNGAVVLVDSGDTAVLAQRSEGAHFGRSPPRNA